MARYYVNDYAKLDEDAINLRVDYGFLDYKVDVFQLARYLGITLIPYSTLTEEIRAYLSSTLEFNDGFTIFHSVNNEIKFYTYYNDELPKVRQRFTIAHEIKHVIYREENPTDKDESLADHFARVLLAPSCLVMFLMENHDLLELCDFFEMSYEATKNALYATEKRVKAKGKTLNQYEIDYIDLIKSNLG